MNYASRQEEFHFLCLIAIPSSECEQATWYVLPYISALFLAFARRIAGNGCALLVRCLIATKRVQENNRQTT
jgi:hypothetical protein